MRYFIPFIVVCILALIILYSLAEIGVFYVRRDKGEEHLEEKGGWQDSKEQIITDLTEENERLKSKLQSYESDDAVG